MRPDQKIVWLSLIAATCIVPAAQSQTVQLPTYRQFAVSTSVLVPDRGAAHLGGTATSRSGQSSFGPGNRALGADRGASGATISAWIHDFEAMDAALLGQAASRVQPLAAADPPGTVMSEAIERNPLQSVAEIRRRQAAAQQQTGREAIEYFEKARDLEASGKPGVAKIYYQMALRRATGPFKNQVAVQLAALNRILNR